MTPSKRFSIGPFSMISAALLLGLASASPAMAAVTFNGAEMNGRTVQGLALNHRSIQGISLNHRSLQGLSLNHRSVQGITLNHRSVQGEALNYRSRQGVALQGPAATDVEGRPLGAVEVRNGRLVIRAAE